jgi:hypothetical protein
MSPDLPSLIAPILLIGVLFATVAFALVAANNTRKKFIDAFLDDKDVNATVIGNGGMVRVFTVGERWRTHLTCYTPGGKEVTWTLRARPPSFSARTTLSLRREGFAGFVRERLFDSHDIHVGDVTFDDALQIGGSDDRVVRAIFANPALRAAVLRAFDDLRVVSISIDEHEARVLAYKTLGDADAAKRVVLGVADLLAALDGASSVAALPPSSTDGLVHGPSASAESGAPVAVPIAGVRR